MFHGKFQTFKNFEVSWRYFAACSLSVNTCPNYNAPIHVLNGVLSPKVHTNELWKIKMLPKMLMILRMPKTKWYREENTTQNTCCMLPGIWPRISQDPGGKYTKTQCHSQGLERISTVLSTWNGNIILKRSGFVYTILLIGCLVQFWGYLN